VAAIAVTKNEENLRDEYLRGIVFLLI